MRLRRNLRPGFGSPTVSVFEFLAKELLDFYFGRLKKLDNHRPDWLQGMELDRHYPEIGVAIEFQGPQHYRPTVSMGQNRPEFFRRLEDDTKKQTLCRERGVTLLPIGLSDLDPHRFKPMLKRIAEIGKRNIGGESGNKIYSILKAIRFDRDPDPRLLRRLAGLRR